MTRAAFLLILNLCLAPLAIAEPTRIKTDVCVYGGTAGGVAAAVTVAKQGHAVVLIEPSRHLGGMTSGGLGATDIGNKAVIGGLSRQFYKDLGRFYNEPESWKFQPRHAEQILREWVEKHKVHMVIHDHRLASVKMNGKRITTATFDKAPTDETGAPIAQPTEAGALVVEAAIWIDATYEGDLLAKAGVSYDVGREAVATYGETLNGVRATTPKHQFLVKTDPYVIKGDPASGLLPLIQKGDGAAPGERDERVQAYNFRMCLTQDPAIRVPITAPANYDEKTYELLGRYLDEMQAQGRKVVMKTHLLSWITMPGGKTDINNNGAVSTDFIGESHDYPEGDWAIRRRIWKAHQDYVRGLFYYLANSPRVPEHVRTELAPWGLCKDEFVDTQNWPHQLYVREARRMIGRYVITQADCEHKRTIDDPVGMGAYNMDSHNVQRIVKRGFVENEGDVQVAPAAPYPISYRSITPRAEECENLIVPVCFSSSHIAYGSARMEPVFMVLGESSGIAASMALRAKTTVQQIDYPALREKLLAAGQVLTYTKPAPPKK